MTVLTAIIPVFLIILSGYLCKHFRFPDPSFWRGAEKIAYFFLFPALLVSKMSTADLAGINFINPVIVIVLLYSVVTGLMLLSKQLTPFSNTQFTSVYQGGIRFNTYIGLAVINTLYGSEGLVIAVIMASIMIPTLNIFCVLVLEYFGEQRSGPTALRIARSIISNPLIVACVVGMGINLAGIQLPFVIIETINILANAALPIGLLTVGAALTLDSIRSSTLPLIVSSSVKFLLLPLVAFGLCTLLGVEGMNRNAMVVLTLLPTATASYVLARQLGGDYELMATIITAQTILAGITMPISLLLLG